MIIYKNLLRHEWIFIITLFLSWFFIHIIKDLIDSHKTYFQLSILFILPHLFTLLPIHITIIMFYLMAYIYILNLGNPISYYWGSFKEAVVYGDIFKQQKKLNDVKVNKGRIIMNIKRILVPGAMVNAHDKCL